MTVVISNQSLERVQDNTQSPKMTLDWKTLGKLKADYIKSLIPPEWRLPHIPSIQEQGDVRREFVHQFLSPREIEITETDAVDIVKQTASGTWTAVEVTRAFCHRAALAHQLVRDLLKYYTSPVLTIMVR